MSTTLNAAPLSDVTPYTLPAEWTGLQDTIRVVSGVFRPTYSGAGVSIAVVTSSPTDLLDVTFSVNHDMNLYSDSSGGAFVNSSSDGFVAEVIDNHIRIKPITAGVIGSTIETVIIPSDPDPELDESYVSGDQFRATYNLTTNTIDVYQLTFSAVTPRVSATGLTPAAGMKNGIFMQWSDSGAAGIIAATAEQGVSHSLATLDATARVGGTGYNATTSGMTAITSLTNAAITSTSANAFIYAMNPFVHNGVYLAMGTPSFTASDGTLTADKTSPLNTMEGYQYVTIASALYNEYSLGAAFDSVTDPLEDGDQLHIEDDGTGVLGTDAGLTSFADGVYSVWHWKASTGVMSNFVVRLLDGIVIEVIYAPLLTTVMIDPIMLQVMF